MLAVLILSPKTVAAIIWILRLPALLIVVVRRVGGRIVLRGVVSPDRVVLPRICLAASRIGWIRCSSTGHGIVGPASSWTTLAHYPTIAASVSAQSGIGTRCGYPCAGLVSVYINRVVVIAPGPGAVSVVAISVIASVPPTSVPGIVAPTGAPAGIPAPG